VLDEESNQTFGAVQENNRVRACIVVPHASEKRKKRLWLEGELYLHGKDISTNIGHFYVQEEVYFFYFINIRNILKGMVQCRLPDCDVWLQIFYACSTMITQRWGLTCR
jgi:hypothetical protein